jgi:hypothetical protein
MGRSKAAAASGKNSVSKRVRIIISILQVASTLGLGGVERVCC